MKRPLKIGILTQYYAPDPPSWIPTGLARELARRGHSVRVLTTFPHYETGRISHGYRQRSWFEENDGSVRVRRVPIIPSHSQNPIGRIANYLSFVASVLFAGKFLSEADVIYVYGTPMTVAEPARVWARRRGIPFVLHVQDLWPESVTSSGLLGRGVGRIVTRVLDVWLRSVYDQANAVLAIAPTMRKMLIARGVDSSRCHTVMNWSNDSDGVDAQRLRAKAEREKGLTLVYAGNLGVMQDIEHVIEAVSNIRDRPGLRVLIAGSGVLELRLRGLVDRLGLRNVEFLGRLSGTELTQVYASADFQLVTLRDLTIFSGTIPSKLQNGLANGVPVITTVGGDVRELVDKERLGFTAKPEDADSLAQAIRAAYDVGTEERINLSVRARAYYEQNMSMRSAIDQIEERLSLSARGSRA